MPLVLDAHQLTLIQAWQSGVETGDGPAVHVAALRCHRRNGSLALPLGELQGSRLAAALALVGRWAAATTTDALLAVWHDAQLYGALGDDCPWPGRLCALRIDRFAVTCDYYPAVIQHAGPLPYVNWTVDGAVRDPNPTLPVPMLDLVAGLRERRPGPLRRRRVLRVLRPWNVDPGSIGD
jgi:hypothetical protein